MTTDRVGLDELSLLNLGIHHFVCVTHFEFGQLVGLLTYYNFGVLESCLFSYHPQLVLPLSHKMNVTIESQ